MRRTDSILYIKQGNVISKKTFLYRITNFCYSILEKYNDILIFLSVIPNKKIKNEHKNDYTHCTHLDPDNPCDYGWWYV